MLVPVRASPVPRERKKTENPREGSVLRVVRIVKFFLWREVSQRSNEAPRRPWPELSMQTDVVT